MSPSHGFVSCVCEEGAWPFASQSLAGIAGLRVHRADADSLELSGVRLLCVCDSSAEAPLALRWITRARAGGQTLPILAVGAGWGERTGVRMLEAGADDCCADMSSIAEVRARAKALIRRASGMWLFGEQQILYLNQERLAVGVDGQEVRLTRSQFAIFEYLARHRGRWRTAEAICSEALMTSHQKGSSLVRFHVHNLRRALGSAGNLIRWERGLGYTFVIEPARLGRIELEPAGASA